MQYKVYARMRYVYLQIEKPHELERMIAEGTIDNHLSDIQKQAKDIHSEYRKKIKMLPADDTWNRVNDYHKMTMQEVIRTLIKC